VATQAESLIDYCLGKINMKEIATETVGITFERKMKLTWIYVS